MSKHTIIITFLLLLYSNGNNAHNAPDSLRENAVAVMEKFEAVFSQTDINNATYKETRVITVFNKQGDTYANFYSYGDNFIELKDFSGIIKNASGTVIKKIGKKDLTISSMSENLADDDYSILYECKVPTYPYTIEITYQQKRRNGILNYPHFAPIRGYLMSVKNANYTIELPANMNIRYDSNFDCNIRDEQVGNKHIYTFSAENLKAITKEPLSPSFRDISPHVTIAPSDFCFDSYCGNMDTWGKFGAWLSDLQKGKDTLLEEFTNKVKELVKDAERDREKVEILYKFLQNNWRYVSIQLGIGGLQPIAASSVYKTKFGDCKGLTNLMLAMLKVVDIPSNYCTIFMGDKKYFRANFPNPHEANHVILLVPLKNDSIWLECTSSTIPFGFIHDDIAGHDALVITEGGGKLCRLPVYPDKLNKKVSKLSINISEEGIIKGNMTFEENLHGYLSNVYYMTSKDRSQVLNYINTNIKFPKIQVDNIHTTENKSPLPSCTLTADFSASDFINKTGTRLFVPIYPLNKGNYDIFSSNSRISDIEISYGYTKSDSITFNIPESYTTESLPKDISLNTPYGTFSTSINHDGNKILFTQNIDIFSGKYDKSEYKEIKAFYNEIAGAMKRRMVLKKL